MRTKQIIVPGYFLLLTGILGSFLAAFLLTPAEQFEESVNLHLLNSLVSAVVLFQGIGVLKIVWNLEAQASENSLPFAWFFLAVQHLMFGFGGLLVSVFSQDYSYENAQGSFSWDKAVLPFLFAHAVAINAGLLGVIVATSGGVRRKRSIQNDSGGSSRWNVWSWNDTRAICYTSLALHSIVWLFLIPINTQLPAVVNYVSYGFSETLNASYVLWGLSWGTCKNRKLFIVYNAYFVLLSMVMGQRGEALIPMVVFAIGFLVSPAGQRWNWRVAVRRAPWAIPVLLFCFWISLASEDMRHNFTRGSVEGAADAFARLESMVSGSNSGIVYTTVGSGDDLNGPFRIGSRLFELSGVDVVSRTPSAVPYWGWSAVDTSVLLTGLLPLKLNTGATYNSDPNAGVLFLQSYGWEYVDPTKWNSMPATIVADAWRRFGWPGVIVVFFCGLWAMAKVSILLRSASWRPAMAIFASAMLAYNVAAYDSDIIYLVDYMLRRALITVGYVVLVYVLSMLFGGLGAGTRWRGIGGRRKVSIRESRAAGVESAALSQHPIG
jgi:hypothetical protein